MEKKEYIRPDLTTVLLTLKDVILSSPEGNSTYIGDPGDWGDDDDDFGDNYWNLP